MPSINHIHQYRRHAKNKRLFICADPYCTHYTTIEFLDGKASICNKCQLEFKLDRQQLKNVNPVCLNCSKSKKKVTFNFAKELLEEIMK